MGSSKGSNILGISRCMGNNDIFYSICKAKNDILCNNGKDSRNNFGKKKFLVDIFFLEISAKKDFEILYLFLESCTFQIIFLD